MIRPHHWLIALALAFGVHLMAFAVLAYNDPKGDAADQGVQGIEIDLGMLGDLGEAQETEQPEEVAPPKPPRHLRQSHRRPAASAGSGAGEDPA